MEVTITTENFEQYKNGELPLVVDLWATWCGPCRTIGPILERLANEFQGAVILAKLDVDRNQRLAQQYKAQSIPAVKAFRHGRVASEFVGAIPEPKIREFLRNLLPNEADRLAAQGAAAEGKNQTSLAETAYQQALSQQANHPLATLGLARIRLAQGQTAAAETLLQRLPPTSPQAIEGRRLLIRTRWRAEAGQLGDEAAILARLADTDNGLADRIALGKLRLSQERYPEGLDILLTALRADRRFQESAAHKALLDAFSFLGDENPLTITYRRRLSTALF